MVTNGKTIDLRDLRSEEARISPEVSSYHTALVPVEKSRRQSARLKRNTEVHSRFEVSAEINLF